MATGGWDELATHKVVNSDGMNCPICLEVYRDPRALSCLHTFCCECIHSYVMKMKAEGNLKNGVQCPLCRNISVQCGDSSPEDWAKELPSNYALATLLQSIARGKKAKTDTSYKFGDLLKCQDHGKKIKYYCSTHDHLCCTKCAIITHKKCESVELKNAKIDIEYEELKNSLNDVEMKTKLLSNALGESESTVEQDIRRIEEEMKQTRATILQKLAVFETKTRDAMFEKRRLLKIKNKEAAYESKRLNAAISGSIRILESICEDAPSVAKTVVLKKLKDQHEMYSKESKGIFESFEFPRMNLEVDNNTTRFCQRRKENFGRIDISSKYMKIYHITEKYEILYCLDSSKDEDGSDPFFTGMGFLVDGRILILDTNNKEILIFDSEMKEITRKELPYRPNSMTIIDPDEIVITGGHGINIYSLNETNNLTLKHSVKTDIGCWSISAIDDKHFAVGSCDRNKPVCIVSRQGEVTHFDTEFPDRAYSVQDTKCGFSSCHNVLLTTFMNHNEICIHDRVNKTNLTIIDDYIVKKPKGVAVPRSRFVNFYVCCKDSNCVVELAADGKILSYCDLTEEMKQPGQIALSKDGSRLLVSNCSAGDKIIMLFKLKRGVETYWE